MTADGSSLDKKRMPVTENDIPGIIERFDHLEDGADKKRTECPFLVPKQEIADNGHDLSISKYKEIGYIPVEYPSTQEIMAFLDKKVVGSSPEYLYYLFTYKNWNSGTNKAVMGKTLNKNWIWKKYILIDPGAPWLLAPSIRVCL